MSARAISKLILIVWVWTLSVISARAQAIALATSSTGFSISGGNPTFSAGFGSVNGLGIGAPASGVSVTTTGVSAGALYMTSYNIVVTGAQGNNRQAVVRAYVSSNFSHSTILQLKTCYPSSSCSSAGSFTALSTSSAAPTDIIPINGVNNGTYTASLALFVSNTNGSSAFTGADSATITFNTYSYDKQDNLTFQSSDTLSLNSPSANVQSALRLSLATAPGGLTVSTGSDYSLNFGSVNGLGIGPAAGLTSQAVAGGALYSTAYQLQCAFSSFTATAATLKAYVSTNFAHPAILELRDSSNNSAFAALGTSSVTPTTLTSSAPSGTSLTRYLALFVSNANGATAFTGADSAVVTYILTVP